MQLQSILGNRINDFGLIFLRKIWTHGKTQTLVGNFFSNRKIPFIDVQGY